MKYKLIYDCEFDGHMCYEIIVEKEEDYEMLSYIIVKGDVIEMKELINKILVNNIEYDNNNNSIKVFGYETNYYPENLEEFENEEIKKNEIYGKKEFYLFRYRYFNYEECFIDEQIYLYKEEKEKKKYVSDKIIQNKSFEILNKYISNKGYLVVYGYEALKYLENETLKVFMISFEIINKLDQKYKDIIKNENHKYKETNIVIYNEESIYFEDFLNYGGIIGVISEK